MLSLSAISQFQAEFQRDLQYHSISSQLDNATSSFCHQQLSVIPTFTSNIHEVVLGSVMMQFVLCNEN